MISGSVSARSIGDLAPENMGIFPRLYDKKGGFPMVIGITPLVESYTASGTSYKTPATSGCNTGMLQGSTPCSDHPDPTSQPKHSLGPNPSAKPDIL